MLKKLFGKKDKEIVVDELLDNVEGVEEGLDLEKADTQEVFEEVTENIEDEISEAKEEIRQDADEEIKEVLKEISDEVEKPKKVSYFQKLKEGLKKTQKNITDKIDQLINNYGEIDDELIEEIEDVLIMADVGMETTVAIIDRLKEVLTERKIKDASLMKPVLKDVLVEMMTHEAPYLKVDNNPSIIFVIGVNGAGKTTSIGKITNLLVQNNKTVLLAAADTFRAAAIDQLQVWGQRNKVDVIAQLEGSDPAAVVYDAIHAARSRKTDVLIVDTAGRLHNKKNLMKELEKIFKVVEREYAGAEKEVLLVLDGTTGQNAIQQAKLFKEVAPISGIVLTKLDGTAKGGVVLAVNHELNIPVKLIGVGEGIDDMQYFNPSDFATALLGE